MDKSGYDTVVRSLNEAGIMAHVTPEPQPGQHEEYVTIVSRRDEGTVLDALEAFQLLADPIIPANRVGANVDSYVPNFKVRSSDVGRVMLQDLNNGKGSNEFKQAATQQAPQGGRPASRTDFPKVRIAQTRVRGQR